MIAISIAGPFRSVLVQADSFSSINEGFQDLNNMVCNAVTKVSSLALDIGDLNTQA